MKLQLIASDLDGTLLGPNATLSPLTIAALQRAHDAGVVIVAATGRSQHSALELLRPAGVVSWAICSNGATRYDLVADSVVHHHMIDAVDVEVFIDRLRTEFGEIGVAWETTEHMGWDELYDRHRNALIPRPEPQEGRIVPFPVGENLVKLLVTHPALTHDEWLDAVTPHAGGQMSVSTSGTDFVEITHAIATKGQELASLCEQLGIAASGVAAFGDQVNDLDMVQWAGRGYAMENASPKLKNAASHCAPHHGEHGVAAIIDELLDGIL
ncbi:MAG: HAD family phosphatase [Acidimicrobiales bacterium]|nr:HAD family phosphatase [Acidimicrobiales bacterium]